ncbi:MAG: hypothetical protein M1569_01675 [Candidatus Marsarchaeota archaeon]|nr:hypothetical protein [Candidatus Marsarchaeota archaeon]MCL5413091.1 hypothetical protein [Candidatus Marsarchaeota archaeon]
MQKVRVFSLDGDKPAVVAALHVMGVIDLRKSRLLIGDDHPAADATSISDALIKVTGALQLLQPHSIKQERHRDADRLIAEVGRLKVLNEIYDLGNERKLIEDDRKAVSHAERIASVFSDVEIDFGRTRSDHINYRAFETDAKGASRFVSAAGREKDMEIIVRKEQKKSFLVLVAYGKSRSIDEYLKGIKINELDLAGKYLEGSPASVIQTARKKREDNARRLSAISKTFADISSDYFSRLSNLKEMLGIELERSEVSGSFKRTDKTFVIEGWVQKRLVGELRERLTNVTDGRVHIDEIEGDELAPTHTRRPKILQPFDYLVSFYSVQRSDEIDPTWIFILSFPIFYGLMVTDVGYGIASLLLATFIIRRTDPEGLMYNAGRIWQINSFAAIFFGFLSNQYFGFQLPYSTPFSFDWLKNTPELIAITVIFGIIQVILGLGLGIYNSYNHGHKKIAYAKFTSILVVLFGTMAVAGAFFGAFNGIITEISGAIAVVSLLLTGVLSGSEATEITNLITHPLSYARLMGFGLGSVIIAFLIDMAFTPHFNGGVIGAFVFLVYLVIFIALHFLNMVLSIFEGIVQGVRLNFVEFFSKFYIGNGIRFKPFGYKRVYTKE